ncbi:MAG TPA: hypothetical protein VEY71_00915 [Chitinophagales bacterium]|nr:hypothetical protein [Chitinophagales bacterium]
MRYRFYLNPDGVNVEVSEPIGWDAVRMNLKRDLKTHGFTFEYAIDLEFTDEGYAFINTAYDAEGIQANVQMSVMLECDEGAEPEEVYRGKLNLSLIEWNYSVDCSIKCGVEQMSCLMTFRNRIDQKVDLSSLESFDGEPLEPYISLSHEVTLPNKVIPKTIDVRAHENSGDYSEYVEAANPASPIGLWLYSYWELGFNDEVATEIPDYAGLTLNRKDGAAAPTADPGPATVAPLFVCTEANTYSLDILLNIDFHFGALSETPLYSDPLKNSFSIYHTMVVLDINGTLHVLYDSGVINNITPTPPNKTNCDPPDSLVTSATGLTYNNPSLALEVGDYVKLYAMQYMGGDYQNSTTTVAAVDFCQRVSLREQSGEKSHFKMYVESVFPATRAKLNLINEALSRVAEATTNDCLRVYSDYFGRTDAQPYPSPEDGCASLVATLNGLQARQFPDKPQRVSFKDLLDGLNPIYNIGVGIEDDPNRPGFQLLRVEPMEYFYNDAVVLTLDKINRVQRRVATDRIYSLFKIGFQKWEAEEFSGLDEMNTQREYRTSLTNVNNTYEQLSKFIGSGYALEITRRLTRFKASTKDWRYDNDNFILCLRRSGTTFVPEQGNIDAAANLIDPPTVLNFRISPARNAMRWMKWIMQSYKNLGGKIIFSDGTGNYKAAGLLNDGCVYEAAPIGESQDLGTDAFFVPETGMPVLMPEEYEFTHPLSWAEYKALKANPYGIISIRWGQRTEFVDCHLLGVQYKPVQGEADFTLVPRTGYGDGGFNEPDNLELREDGDLELRDDSFNETRE